MVGKDEQAGLRSYDGRIDDLGFEAFRLCFLFSLSLCTST